MRTMTPIALAGLVALAATPASAEMLRFMTGPQGGSWYPLGGAIQSIVQNNMEGTQVQVLPGAGIANVKGVQEGKVQLGFANSVSTVDAIEGKPPFEGKADDVCNVATLYPQYFQVVALAGEGIETPADFKGKAAAIQPKGNTAEAITLHMLEAYGLSEADLASVSHGSYTDAVSLMKDGNATFFTLGTTVPAGSVMDLASARKIELVPIEGEGLAKMQELNSGYKAGTIPAGTYPGQDADVPVIVYATHLIAQCSLDETVVHDLLKSIVANKSTLESIAAAMKSTDLATMATDIGVPMHPGAKKFYEEEGAL